MGLKVVETRKGPIQDNVCSSFTVNSGNIYMEIVDKKNLTGIDNICFKFVTNRSFGDLVTHYIVLRLLIGI